MNAFEVLGLAPGVSEKEIKKAYFAAVRQFPPDKEPEKFKEIRAAYETLCDSEKRKHSQMLAEISPEARKLVEAAEGFMREDDAAEAMKCLDEALRIAPDSLTVINLIGNVHMANGKFGLAVKHYEKYCQMFPQCLLFSSRLAVAYWQRSWSKKAKTQFLHTIGRGYLTPEFLEEFVDFCLYEEEHELLESVLLRVLELYSKEEHVASAVLCLSAMYKNAPYLDAHSILPGFGTDWVKAYLEKRPVFQTAGFFTELLTLLIEDADDEDVYELARGLPDLAVATAPAAGRDFAFGKARFRFELASLCASYFPIIKHDAGASALCKYAIAIYEKEYETRSSYADYALPEKSFEVFDTQMDLLYTYHKHKPNFRMLIDRYPYIWTYMDEFVTKLQSASNLAKFSNRHAAAFLRSASPELKSILKEKLPRELFEHYEMQANAPAPARSVKIPPNSPCPCGSGKKYKKCCGKHTS